MFLSRRRWRGRRKRIKKKRERERVQSEGVRSESSRGSSRVDAERVFVMLGHRCVREYRKPCCTFLVLVERCCVGADKAKATGERCRGRVMTTQRVVNAFMSGVAL